MAVFGYARVSTAEQTVENQRLEIERAGYQIDFWFSDTISGKLPAAERPEFKALLQQIRDGEHLVVTKLDRLGRDAQDVAMTIKALAKRRIEVVVLQLGKLDLGSPAGKLMLTMLSAMAEMERDLLIERTQAGLARAKSQGKVLGRPTKTTATERADIIKMHAAGSSISALARTYKISRASVLAITKSARQRWSRKFGQSDKWKPCFIIEAGRPNFGARA